MLVDGGLDCRDFLDKHLFYILFGSLTSVHVSGGSTLSAAGVVLIPVMFPGYPTLHLFDPSYWIPTDRTKTLSISALKFIEALLGPPMNLYNLTHSATLKTTLLPSMQLEKQILTTSTFTS